MKTSVLMTVHDREHEVLLATLRSLYRSGLADAELIIVNDRSSLDYSWVKGYAKHQFREVRWIDTGDYEGFRIEGYGNPAHAFNLGLEAATGDRLVVMSSDVIVTPGAVASMDRFWTPEVMYTPLVLDLDSRGEYCGPSRAFPMPWFLVMPTAVAQQIGGWDEKFLQGLCFEDNDFVGRMALRLGVVRCDWQATTYHQSHVQPAYDTTSEEVVAANLRNRGLCKSIWGGIPWDPDVPCSQVRVLPDPSGCRRLTFENSSLKEKWFAVKA